MPILLPCATPDLPLAFIEGIGAMEMMLVLIVGLLLFGGKGLPDMARTLGKVMREFRKATASVEQEVKRVMNEEPPEPALPPSTNSRPRSSPPRNDTSSSSPTTPATPSDHVPPPSGPAAIQPRSRSAPPPPSAPGDPLAD